MTEFKMIDDQLFELVTPTPLTQDAEFPCLVRFIADDSPMGLHNKQTYGFTIRHGNDALLVNELSYNYMCYEIIGYPVADHSAKWALYKMMQGNTVYRDEWVNDMCCKLKDDVVETYVSGILCFFNPIKDWLEFAEITIGWQIYEPEIEFNEKPKAMLANAKVGDWVEYHESPHETSIGYIAELLPDGKASVFFIDEMDIDVVDMSSLSAYDLRKVIVTIGCLSGTVESSPWNDSRFILRTKRGKCWIPKDALDAPTRELVERLLDKEGK